MPQELIRTSIAPWLTVSNSLEALEFYQAAFQATESYRLETPGGIIARLAVQGAEFWISEGGNEVQKDPEQLGGGTVRLILVTAHPEEVFRQAIKAGGSEIFPVGEGHGWKLGRIVDPFGLHWEIGHPLTGS